MNVICSIDRGEVPIEQCLECSKKEENRCGYDFVLLKKMFAVNERDWRRSEIHVTDITGCLRKAWYEKTHTKAELVHELMVRSIGTIMHESMQIITPDVESEVMVKWEQLVGSADIYYSNGRLLDIKTVRWLRPDRLPYGSHSLQINIYGWMLRKMGKKVEKMQIQYIDMSGPTKCRKCNISVRMENGRIHCPSCGNTIHNSHLGAMLMEIEPMHDNDIARLVKDRQSALAAALITGMPPEVEPGYLCIYCNHQLECQPNVDPE
jgi:hypothetical protein